MLNPLAFFRRSLAWRLWGAMMLLACVGVAFLWIVQVALLEPNYVRATAAVLTKNVEPVTSGLRKADDLLALSELSKGVNGKVYLVDEDGHVLFVYGMGMRGDLRVEMVNDRFLYRDRNYRRVVEGETIQAVINRGEPDMKVAMGFPATYRGRPAAIFLYSSLSELRATQVLMRVQLVRLSLVLTAAASVLAFFLTRHFTKPILSIKETVDKLAAGDLDASPVVRQDDEIGRLSRSVAELGTALKRVDVLRKEVIANVSHELRSPMSLIAGYGEMVRDITWRDEKRRNDDLNVIIREAGRLSRMVDDILDYSQLRAGYGKLNRVGGDLYAIAAAEAEFCLQAAREHGFEIVLRSFASEIPASLDVLKITRVFHNLLGNAINHAADGEIELRIEQNASGIRASVINRGEEIPAESRSVIWERYQRVQHQGGRREGTGIGLSIVAAILEAHGFAYGVDCADGKNSFWFEIPRD